MHKLRHTHASLLLEAGAEMKYIQQRLGHSSDRITTEVYAHMTDKMRNRQKKNIKNILTKFSTNLVDSKWTSKNAIV